MSQAAEGRREVRRRRADHERTSYIVVYMDPLIFCFLVLKIKSNRNIFLVKKVDGILFLDIFGRIKMSIFEFSSESFWKKSIHSNMQ